jgi:DNA-binding CsgD family transcriptional regulator
MAHRITDGASAGCDDLRTALELWCTHAEGNDGQALRWITLAFPIIQETAADMLWDDDVQHRLATAMVGYAREAGALAVLPPALGYRAGVHLLAGEFATAATLLEEADSISMATGYTPVRYHSLMIAAWRGVPDDARRLIDAASADAADRGEGRLLGVAGYATAALYNGLGRYDEAFAAARKACEHEDLGFHSWCLFELIEAAARTGQLDASAAALHLFEERARAGGTDWSLGAVANAQALLADNEAADALFNEAIARLERTRVVLHLARARLNYGEWLRRVNRRLDARQQLNKAHEMFTRMGAQGYAERARRELLATGEKVRKQRLSSGDALTAQEAQIGRLAGDGLTNQEIGAQLFISTHTVEWHLRKVFVKLGVTSRRQLRTFKWAS